MGLFTPLFICKISATVKLEQGIKKKKEIKKQFRKGEQEDGYFSSYCSSQNKKWMSYTLTHI